MLGLDFVEGVGAVGRFPIAIIEEWVRLGRRDSGER